MVGIVLKVIQKRIIEFCKLMLERLKLKSKSQRKIMF